MFKSKKDKRRNPGCSVISVMNQKGGVGKTTLSFNLAFALKEKGYKVLCIDSDPQANLSALFVGSAEFPRFNIFNLLINSVKELKNLHSAALLSEVMVSLDGVDCIVSGQDLSGFELTVAGINSPRQLILERMITKYEIDSIYDFIIVDGPPTLGLLLVNMICASDGVFFPFIPDNFSEQGIKNIKQVFEDVLEMGVAKEPVVLGYVPNLFETRRRQANDSFASIERIIPAGQLIEPLSNKASMARAMAQSKSVFHSQAKEFHSYQKTFNDMAKRCIKLKEAH